MIILAIKDGRVVNHGPPGSFEGADASYEIVEWDGDPALLESPAYEATEDDILGVPMGEPPKDPRTQGQKNANKAAHRARCRKMAMPTVEEALAMMAHDLERVTPTYQAAIAAANALHPEP